MYKRVYTHTSTSNKESVLYSVQCTIGLVGTIGVRLVSRYLFQQISVCLNVSTFDQ